MQRIINIVANNEITPEDSLLIQKTLLTLNEEYIVWLDRTYKSTIVIKPSTSVINGRREDDNVKVKNYIIGLWYYTQKRYEYAFEVFSRNTNYVKCQIMLALMYQYGKGVEQNFENMIEIMTIAGENDGNAQYYLAAYYENGKYVDQDIEKAIEWYRKSARSDNVSAQYRLGIILYEGLYDTEPDVNSAVDLLLLSATGNNSDAQFYLGKHYYNENRFRDADKWLVMAVDSGNAEAMLYLAQIYENRNITYYIDQIINLYMSVYLEYEETSTASESKDDTIISDEEKESFDSNTEHSSEQGTEQSTEQETFDVKSKRAIKRLIGVNDIGFEYLKRRLMENERLHNIIISKR